LAAARSAPSESCAFASAAKGHEAARSCHGRDDEAVQVVEHGAGDELAEEAGLAAIGGAECPEVAGAVALVDDRGRVAEPDQREVEEQPSGSTVAVEERVDALEEAVRGSQRSTGASDAATARRSSTHPRIAGVTSVHGGGVMPAGTGRMSCSRNAPGRSRSLASGCGAKSHAGPIAIVWTWRTSVNVTSEPVDHSPGSSACPYTQRAACA
jgi:hypothetical protein